MQGRTKPYRFLNSEATVLRGCLAVIRDWGLADHIRRQNVGGIKSGSGQYVAFGRPGDSDLGGVLPSWFGVTAGKRIIIEVKREGFNPPKPSNKFPTPRMRLHWELQIGQLIFVNAAGGYAFWCDDAAYLWRAFDLIRKGYRVSIGEDEYPEFYQEPQA